MQFVLVEQTVVDSVPHVQDLPVYRSQDLGLDCGWHRTRSPAAGCRYHQRHPLPSLACSCLQGGTATIIES